MKHGAPVMMGITSPTGSHLPILEAAIAALPSGSLVVEHGAGLYSTPLLTRSDVRVLCAEEHIGWAEWARWLYRERGEIVDVAKRLVPRLPEVALAFIDGEARHRGFLIAACLTAKVPTVIAHDTEEQHWDLYGYQPHLFSHPGYTVSHDSEPHRTTIWLRRG